MCAGGVLATHYGGNMPRACEVDEAALRVGVDELQPHAISHVESRLTLLDPAVYRQVQNACTRSLGIGPGDDAVELLADRLPVQASRLRLAQQPLDLVRGLLL